MRAQLDTSAFLWGLLGDPRLSTKVRRLMHDPENSFCVSPAVGWEIVLKYHSGKLKLPDTPGRFIVEAMSAFSFESLPIEMRHALRVETLADHHRDPFDRILIAQSLVEGIPILTADPIFARYGVEVIW